MNEDQQVSAEEFAHENEHIRMKLNYIEPIEEVPFKGVAGLFQVLGWMLLAAIAGYVLWLLFFRAIPFLINS